MMLATEPLQLGTIARNASESAHPELWRGLVGAWVPALGYQGARLIDQGMSSEHGTLQGSVFWDGATSLEFPGTSSDYVETTSDGVAGTSGRTVLVRFRRSSHSSSEGMFSYGALNEADGGGVFRFRLESGVIWLRVYSGATSWGSGFDDGAWHTAVMSMPDGATLSDIRVVVDGVDYGLGSGTQTIDTDEGTSTYEPVRFGIDINQGNLGNPFSGSLSSSVIWGHQLTISAMRAVSLDPLAPFRRADDAWLYAATAGTGFQPAWALYSNDTIGAA